MLLLDSDVQIVSMFDHLSCVSIKLELYDELGLYYLSPAPYLTNQLKFIDNLSDSYKHLLALPLLTILLFLS